MSIPDPSETDQPLDTSGAAGAIPAGMVAKADPEAWYRLKVTYEDEDGTRKNGYLHPVGANAATSFWDYVMLGHGTSLCGALQFKLVPDGDGWARWEIRDDDCNSGYHLECKATGWLYRASAYDTKFQIVDGKLYCSYWDGPVGSDYRYKLVPAGRYAGMDLPAFSCELEKV
jgi:hypothetical protein